MTTSALVPDRRDQAFNTPAGQVDGLVPAVQELPQIVLVAHLPTGFDRRALGDREIGQCGSGGASVNRDEMLCALVAVNLGVMPNRKATNG